MMVMTKRKLITKPIQDAIDNHNQLIWIRDHLQNMYLCRVSFHENGHEIIRKLAGFNIPDDLERVIELHHAVFDAIRDPRDRPQITEVLKSFSWKGLIAPGVLAREIDRERNWIFTGR